jgi:hypothetical protein
MNTNVATGMKIKKIVVHPRETAAERIIGLSNKFIVVYPLYTDNTVTPPSNKYADLLITGDATFQTGTGTPEIFIDLKTHLDIGYIEIIHETTADAATVNNAVLTILKDSSPVNKDSAVVVFTETLTATTNTTRTIYTQDKHLASSTLPITQSFIYPGCSGCVLRDNSLLRNYKYSVSDGRCFRVNDNTIPVTKTNLDDAIAKTPESITALNSNTYFTSCLDTEDTRKSSPIGRFVRLQAIDILNDVKLSIFAAFTVDAVTGNSVFAAPLDIHVRPYDSASVTAYNSLLTAPPATNIGNNMSSGLSPGVTSYIQLDLGSDIIVKSVQVKKHTSDPNALPNLRNLRLIIFKADGTVTYQVDLSTINDNTLSNFVIHF